MTYEPLYERFEVVGPGGNRLEINFVRAGFLTEGDRPELFFFRVNGEEAVVGISGLSLARFERGRTRLSREQKIDLTGRWLKRQIEACAPLPAGQAGGRRAGLDLDPRSLYIQDNELANLASELDFTE